jgi:hypothetical protein
VVGREDAVHALVEKRLQQAEALSTAVGTAPNRYRTACGSDGPLIRPARPGRGDRLLAPRHHERSLYQIPLIISGTQPPIPTLPVTETRNAGFIPEVCCRIWGLCDFGNSRRSVPESHSTGTTPTISKLAR